MDDAQLIADVRGDFSIALQLLVAFSGEMREGQPPQVRRCWCGMHVGNPLVRRHTTSCDQAAALLTKYTT